MFAIIHNQFLGDWVNRCPSFITPKYSLTHINPFIKGNLYWQTFCSRPLLGEWRETHAKYRYMLCIRFRCIQRAASGQ